MTDTTIRVPLAFARIAALAERDAIRNINKMPGCWERALPDGWRFSLNGHDVPTKDSSGASVPVYSAMVFYNDWPVGVIDPVDGVMMRASEDAFIAALDAELNLSRAETNARA